jgi:hypothetical protein
MDSSLQCVLRVDAKILKIAIVGLHTLKLAPQPAPQLSEIILAVFPLPRLSPSRVSGLVSLDDFLAGTKMGGIGILACEASRHS